MVQLIRNILGADTCIKFITSTGSDDCCSDLFADVIPEYDSSKGYYKIKNPGWAKITLSSPERISYIRFLLWDNRGSAAKRQPSNRKYTYRLLIAEAQYNPSGIADDRGVVWTAVYENSLNPSNGWQEFFFEDGARDILAIKIQFFQNTTASNSHKSYTQLVSVQAYSAPTSPIKQLLADGDDVLGDDYCAPLPTYGFIRNRVIIGGEQEVVNNIVEDEIINEVTSFIKSVEHDVPALRQLRNELEEGMINEGGKTDIEKQIHLFNSAILKPIESYDKRLTKRYKKYTYVAILIFVLGIVQEIVDIVSLYFDNSFSLSIGYIFDWLFR